MKNNNHDNNEQPDSKQTAIGATIDLVLGEYRQIIVKSSQVKFLLSTQTQNSPPLVLGSYVFITHTANADQRSPSAALPSVPGILTGINFSFIIDLAS